MADSRWKDRERERESGSRLVFHLCSSMLYPYLLSCYRTRGFWLLTEVPSVSKPTHKPVLNRREADRKRNSKAASSIPCLRASTYRRERTALRSWMPPLWRSGEFALASRAGGHLHYWKFMTASSWLTKGAKERERERKQYLLCALGQVPSSPKSPQALETEHEGRTASSTQLLLPSFI